MPVVMLDRPSTAVFRRTVKDKNGGFLRQLKFKGGEPVELKGRDWEAVQRDLGHALVEVKRDAKGRMRAVRSQPIKMVEIASDELEVLRAAVPPEGSVVLTQDEYNALRAQTGQIGNGENPEG